MTYTNPEPSTTNLPGGSTGQSDPLSNSWRTAYALEQQYKLGNAAIKYWIKTQKLSSEDIRKPFSDLNPTKNLLIREAAVKRHVESEYVRPSKELPSSPIVIQHADPKHIQVITPAPIVKRSFGTETREIAGLPEGFRTTDEIAKIHLAQLKKLNKDGKLSSESYDKYERYYARWAAFAPAFPWTQENLEDYDTSLTTNRWEHIRFVNTLTIWAKRRYPQINLPSTAKLGVYKAKRHPVLAKELEIPALEAMKAYRYELYLACLTTARTGCRGFELREAEWQSLSPTGFRTKGRAKKPQGLVYFPNGLYKLILTMPGEHTGVIFKDHRGLPYTHDMLQDEISLAWNKANLPPRRRLGIYMFRHMFAERMKGKIPLEQLATIMRTSVKMLETVYGMHDDPFFTPVLNEASKQVWGDDLEKAT